MKNYHLSPSGQRTTLVLLAGALVIWAFAIWTLRSSLAALNTDGPTVSQVVPALLMVILIIATPLVIWNLLEEWSAQYTTSPDGLQFRSMGLVLTIPWDGISAVRLAEQDADEPVHELLLTQDISNQIGNPLVRFLHTQAYGSTKLPIFGGLADREQLLHEIQTHTGVELTPSDSA